ncbi:MAG: DUF2163 domain-containing protein [Pseudomonadota bacterium]
MPQIPPELKAHIEGGLTTLAHAWSISRTDGTELGFTDHDKDLSFEGVLFRADTGLSALSLAQSTGLSVDNSEAVGALSDVSIRADEIEQGRFDNAEIRAWLVNWQDVSQRWLQFRGSVGEIQRSDGGFRAELRGLTDALNQPQGRVYQQPCGAVLGDDSCRVNLNSAQYRFDTVVETVRDQRQFSFSSFGAYASEWFSRGRLEVLSGPNAGLWGTIKQDTIVGAQRVLTLWDPIRGVIEPGTQIRVLAGCDKRSQTCRSKFNNYLNYRGFPDVPSEDWMLALPKSGGSNTGGSRR